MQFKPTNPDYKKLLTSYWGKHLLCALVLLVASFHQLSAQEKFEKETRLTEENVPINALSFWDSLNLQTKVRWYLEESLVQKSVEAKFKWEGQQYSVEFDSTGHLEDIEVKVKWNRLESMVKDTISAFLEKDCEKFSVRKVQIQYSGDRSALKSIVKSNNREPSVIVNYEVVVKCRQQHTVALYEYLFNEWGKKLARYQVVFKNSSNLEY